MKRRHIYRVGAAYAVVAWVLLQLVANVAPILDLPPWIARTILLLLALGFPLALVFAWVHQLAPESGALTRITTGKMDWFLAGALVVVIGLVSYQQFAPAFGSGSVESPRASVAAASTPAIPKAAIISIAVLPFSNLSSDPEQEFFSDGITEEITAALAKVVDLRVVARTSAFQFKDANKDMRTVGQALGATHLIEGSVRKAGNRVRITAQLIKTDDGTHIWSENYDRELTDVFAIQEDIATAIAAALRVPLSLKPGQTLVSNRNIDPETYQQYLRAKALVRARGRARIASATVLLEQIVVGDPDYAPAWALLGLIYQLTPNGAPERTDGPVEAFREVVKTNMAKAEAAAKRAIALDPNLADGYIVLTNVQGSTGDLLQALEIGESKVLALDPNNADALNGTALGLAIAGHSKEALAMRQRLLELEPTIENYRTRTALLLWVTGKNDAAIAMLKELPPERQDRLAPIYASMGRYKEAIDVLENLPPGTYPPQNLKDAIGILRTAPAKTASPQSLPPLGALNWVYLYVGTPERVLDIFDRGLDAGYLAGAGDPDALWHPAYTPVRRTEHFKTYVRRSGLLNFWRAKGWPDACHATGADDFVCT